jgi:hypothetical protein
VVVIADIIKKEVELYSMLVTSIRYHLVKRGICIKENVYIGFDTEFTYQTKTKTKITTYTINATVYLGDLFKK